MKLFFRESNLIKDLLIFSKIFTNAVTGTSIKSVTKDKDKLDYWGSASTKYHYSYGRELKYRKIEFWSGLIIKGHL